MSGVNITILEGGKAENFGQVTKLRTDNGDGHDLWVPKVDVQTKSLSVKKNGLYYTKEYTPTSSEKKDGHAYDIYGWDTITVSVKKKVKGKKKKTDPSTGLDYDVPATVEVDDNGNLVEKEVPTSINIVKEPTTTTYVDGQSISIAGIKVKAYLEDGTEWGDVPFNELSFEPTVARVGEGGKTSDLDTNYEKPIRYSGNNYYRRTDKENEGFYFSCGDTRDDFVKYVGNTTDIKFIVVEDTNNHLYNIYRISPHPFLAQAYFVNGEPSGVGELDSGTSFTHNNKTIYYQKFTSGGPIVGDIAATPDYIDTPDIDGATAWTVWYGKTAGSTNDVTVTWNNDDLDEPLTDKYSIVVVPSPIPPNIEGGNNGDNTGSDLGEDPDHPITPHI